MTKLILRVLTTCFTLSLPSQSAASPIVDTGTPPPGLLSWGLVTNQYFAGEFTILDTYLIQTIEGYIGNITGEPGTVDIAIHADGGNTPGDLMFMASVGLGPDAPKAWYGVSDLNQILTPGTYWASFKPTSSAFWAVMPGDAPNPMSEYAQGSGAYAWEDNGADFYDYLDVGVRINGDLVPASVPDSTPTLSLFVGVALLAFAAERLRT